MIIAQLGLLALAGKPKIETLFFVTSDCPIARRFVPEMKRIMKGYNEVSTFMFVYEDQGVALDKIKFHHADYNIKCPLTLDSPRVLAKKYDVRGVPTALVRNSKGEVLYKGRIDDSYGSDFRWHPAKSQDLRYALQALKEGNPVPVKSTPVIGCTLSN